MNLAEQYDKLYNASIPRIAAGHAELDHLLDSETDNRFGLSLLIRPPESIKNNIQGFLKKLKAIDPLQYYYRNSDMHVTVMSIISCYSGFQLKQIHLPDYVEVIKESLASYSSFKINFQGITASPSSILIKGFLPNSTLNSLRDSLRVNFKNSGLEQTIDKRYSLQTAHATVVRFRTELNQPDEFVQMLNQYRNVEFGSFTVDSVELVFNDWYQRTEKVKSLNEFPLNSNSST